MPYRLEEEYLFYINDPYTSETIAEGFVPTLGILCRMSLFSGNGFVVS